MHNIWVFIYDNLINEDIFKKLKINVLDSRKSYIEDYSLSYSTDKNFKQIATLQHNFMSTCYGIAYKIDAANLDKLRKKYNKKTYQCIDINIKFVNKYEIPEIIGKVFILNNIDVIKYNGGKSGMSFSRFNSQNGSYTPKITQGFMPNYVMTYENYILKKEINDVRL